MGFDPQHVCTLIVCRGKSTSGLWADDGRLPHLHGCEQVQCINLWSHVNTVNCVTDCVCRRPGGSSSSSRGQLTRLAYTRSSHHLHYAPFVRSLYSLVHVAVHACVHVSARICMYEKRCRTWDPLQEWCRVWVYWQSSRFPRSRPALTDVGHLHLPALPTESFFIHSFIFFIFRVKHSSARSA